MNANAEAIIRDLHIVYCRDLREARERGRPEGVTYALGCFALTAIIAGLVLYLV